MVTSQPIEPVRLHLKEMGMRVGRDSILKHRQKPYINSELFMISHRAVFLAHLADLRRKEKLFSEEVALLMDNCSPHSDRSPTS
jgi:hypothetical protein